ncbi:MAG: bifunctional diaminohydroxyphosphoribosylaminopyrimidine deaminase/5-amino-6-(5-phosphoribosylamino)uracil reductase RibD [Bacteroidota bacterium]|nr:bifunctional diaminohydroxyphosphoribosylaminopyrimidine deaminase/5-amino-6-(5-phosphoribosylamino)uracil reductase RibD [Bacteroidota bacterium]
MDKDIIDIEKHQRYLSRCIQIAGGGLGLVAPNPMVGSVIVKDDKIIGEGFHHKFGGNHAEVNAIESVINKENLKESILYVNLEPCSHFGKTPPCTDLIIKHKIPEIVIGSTDPFAEVAGRGIQKLKEAGCKVICDVMKNESIELNKRFFTYHQIKRPYIILKWAQTFDGYIDIIRSENKISSPNWITNEYLRMIVHKWRTEEQAIIVGTKTAYVDNPKLNARDYEGKNPLRIVIDRDLKLPLDLNLFDRTVSTIIYTSKNKPSSENLEYCTVDFNVNIIPQILEDLYVRKIQSLIVEGGSVLINSFYDLNLWDESRVFIGSNLFFNGIKAPGLRGKIIEEQNIYNDKLLITRNI